MTALGDPAPVTIQAGTIQSGMITAGEVRLFPEEPCGIIPAARDLSPAEAAEYRRVLEALAAAGARGPLILPVLRTCPDCGMGDFPPDRGGRCRYCAELAALRARHLPGPPLPGWWYAITGVLGLVLAALIAYAILYVILAS